MPNIDSLMQVWTPEFEELLKEVIYRKLFEIERNVKVIQMIF